MCCSTFKTLQLRLDNLVVVGEIVRTLGLFLLLFLLKMEWAFPALSVSYGCTSPLWPLHRKCASQRDYLGLWVRDKLF